jgi:Tfp pilus assembly protein PilV
MVAEALSIDKQIGLRSDAGFSLIELVIAMFLASSVLFLIAVLVSGIYSVQNSVMASSHSSSESQAFAESFKSSIRSATGTQLTSVTVGNNKGQLLVARVLVSNDKQNISPAGRCIQFLWLNGSIYQSTGVSSVTMPKVDNLHGWSSVVSGVEPVRSGQGVFSQVGLATSVDFVTSLDHGLGSVLSTTQTAPEVTQLGTPCF